jgi:hypothetical protein
VEERHYTVKELAARWNISDDFVIDLLDDEPGVLVWVRKKPGKRTYKIRRIPESVVVRVERRSQNPKLD